MLARTNDYANNNILTFKHHVLDIGEKQKLESQVRKAKYTELVFI